MAMDLPNPSPVMAHNKDCLDASIFNRDKGHWLTSMTSFRAPICYSMYVPGYALLVDWYGITLTPG